MIIGLSIVLVIVAILGIRYNYNSEASDINAKPTISPLVSNDYLLLVGDIGLSFHQFYSAQTRKIAFEAFAHNLEGTTETRRYQLKIIDSDGKEYYNFYH